MLGIGIQFCEIGLRAIAAGGAEPLDSKLALGAWTKSVDIERALGRAKAAFEEAGHQMCLPNPNTRGFEQRFGPFAACFKKAQDELDIVRVRLANDTRPSGASANPPQSLSGEQSSSSPGPVTRACSPNGADVEIGLSRPERMVLTTLSTVDGACLLSVREIVERMPRGEQIAAETARKALNKLIECELAERPEGSRRGARLTNSGRRQAGKIAD